MRCFKGSKDSGFSMLEIVLVIGLFGIVSYVMFGAMTDADNAQHRLNMQLRMRHVLDKTASEISEGSGFFVTVKKSNSVYYACYDREGKRTENKSNTIEYGVTDLANFKIPGKECLGSKFVAYIKPDAKKLEADIYIYMINEKTAKKQAGYKKPIKIILNRGF